MIKVEFLGPIGKGDLNIEISNLNELSVILKEDEDLLPWLDNCAVSINDKIVTSAEYPLNDGDKISLLPPVCGG